MNRYNWSIAVPTSALIQSADIRYLTSKDDTCFRLNNRLITTTAQFLTRSRPEDTYQMKYIYIVNALNE
jgi:hypothetical protein